MFCGSPERTRDFIPTCSKFLLSFQNFPDTAVLNPTFRFVTCGAELARPFGTPVKYMI